MRPIQVIPRDEFVRVFEGDAALDARLDLIADMCRLNTLATVKRAGSGHLGSSFSSLDIVTRLYFDHMNVVSLGFEHHDRDIFFSSKGHDVPGLYAVMYALGVLSFERFIKLRRHGGTCGHPDVKLPGMEANTGSLGMGISKGKGHLWAKALRGRGGRLYVMTGDGEFQEGQIYESLQTAAHQRIPVNVLIDLNRVQSDMLVADIIDLGDLDAKLRSFGCHVVRCDGHDTAAIGRVLTEFDGIDDRPKVMIAETIKGRGVSFMEHPAAMADEPRGLYKWHSGAPDDDSYGRGFDEIHARIDEQLAAIGANEIQLQDLEPEVRPQGAGKTTREFVAVAYGEALHDLAEQHQNFVVLDADLSIDCRTRKFEYAYPERFLENGIAEQDMVSAAGAIARQGLLPFVNSFASFLSSRSNEQIYNNACESGTIVYAMHYAGLIPAGPGQSHQSVRDISLMAALPGPVTILQPCNPAETRMAVEWCITEAKGVVALRLIIGPSPRPIELPENYAWSAGRGARLSEGSDIALFSYGPTMLHEALLAAETNPRVRVIDQPWLNLFDRDWIAGELDGISRIAVLEDHAPTGGMGDHLLRFLVAENLLEGRKFDVLGVEGLPSWGTPWEALGYHGLDGASVAARLGDPA